MFIRPTYIWSFERASSCCRAWMCASFFCNSRRSVSCCSAEIFRKVLSSCVSEGLDVLLVSWSTGAQSAGDADDGRS